MTHVGGTIGERYVELVGVKVPFSKTIIEVKRFLFCLRVAVIHGTGSGVWAVHRLVYRVLSLGRD